MHDEQFRRRDLRCREDKDNVLELLDHVGSSALTIIVSLGVPRGKSRRGGASPRWTDKQQQQPRSGVRHDNFGVTVGHCDRFVPVTRDRTDPAFWTYRTTTRRTTTISTSPKRTTTTATAGAVHRLKTRGPPSRRLRPPRSPE